MIPAAVSAFNPDEGKDSVVAKRDTTYQSNTVRTRLPSTAPLTGPVPRLVFPVSSTENPLPAIEPVPVAEAVPTYVTPAPMQLPPVDEAVKARAEAELHARAPIEPVPLPATVIAAPPVFVPPAPLPAQSFAAAPPATTVAAVETHQMPAALPEPLAASHLPAATTPVPVTASAPLSNDTKRILSGIPSKLDTPKKKTGKLAINRMNPDVKSKLDTDGKVDTYSSAGISIKVQRPGLDTNFELNRAYDALMAGDTATAIATYKNILAAEPSNEDALFGAAATYHRLGDIAHARPYYGQLLKVNPQHREGLNNFLALVGDESPQEALAELERLEQRNPEFSPIPAQQAVILNKMGYSDHAREKMLRAIELAPENLTYKYNLAVMLDRQGNYADASALYRLLIDAALNGQKIPAPTEALQKRLNYLMAASPDRLAGS